MNKIIVRIKGGPGNQLFCYAAARRLALINNAELVIDDVTGFIRDHLYQHRYMLQHFHIPVHKATSMERLEPFERYRRAVMKWICRRRPFMERYYLEQEYLGFDERLINLKVKGKLYLDGLWQSEGYFKDVEEIIRSDLKIIPPLDCLNQHMAEKIRNDNSVALHVRWFDKLNSNNEIYNISTRYYTQAISLIEEKVNSPQYFLFSDDPDAASAKLALPEDRVTLISHNQGNENAYADLWLMSQCKHFIIANSTFSWWGAWLGSNTGKIVIAPDFVINGKTAWGFKGLIPERWIVLKNSTKKT